MKNNGRFVGISTTPTSVGRTAWRPIRSSLIPAAWASPSAVAICVASLGYCIAFGAQASAAAALSVVLGLAAAIVAAAPQLHAALRGRQALCPCPIVSDDARAGRCRRRARYDFGRAGCIARSLKDTTPGLRL
jgi:hypothetical protein